MAIFDPRLGVSAGLMYINVILKRDRLKLSSVGEKQ